MKSYSRMAAVYDRLMEHIDFPGITGFYLETARSFNWDGRCVLDLACGTGNMTLELLKQGYNVCGLDWSQEMLAAADQKIFKAGFSPNLVCQDMRKIKMSRQFDLVLCAFDSLNYLLNEDDLERTLAGVCSLMHESSLFLFDVHTEYKFKEILGKNTFTHQSDDICYIWQNLFNARKNTCSMKLDIFVATGKDAYQRIEEYHEERYYSPELLTDCLIRQGLEVLAIYGDWKHQKPRSKTERLIFVTRRKR
jgi:SAM-dependent methyltransferase